MSWFLRLTIVFFGLLLICMAIRSVVVRKLSEQQSYFWIFSGFGVILFGLFPQLSAFIAFIFGVEYIPSIIFMLAIVIALYGIFNCFQAIASLNKRVQELAMQVSLLNRENTFILEACAKMDTRVLELQDERSGEGDGDG